MCDFACVYGVQSVKIQFDGEEAPLNHCPLDKKGVAKGRMRLCACVRACVTNVLRMC